MRRRDFLAGATLLCLGRAITPAFARDDEPGDDRGGGGNSGPGGGGDREDRGGGDREDRGGGREDRGGGGRSGHGSIEERSVSIGDSRADRAESRLREDVKENQIQDREFRREERLREEHLRSGDTRDRVRVESQRQFNERRSDETDGFSRLIRDVADLFRAR